MYRKKIEITKMWLRAIPFSYISVPLQKLWEEFQVEPKIASRETRQMN